MYVIVITVIIWTLFCWAPHLKMSPKHFTTATSLPVYSVILFKATYIGCLIATCHLRFWQNDQDLLHATVNMGVEQILNEGQHRKLTVEKKILPLLPPGTEPATVWSRVWHSTLLPMSMWCFYALLWYYFLWNALVLMYNTFIVLVLFFTVKRMPWPHKCLWGIAILYKLLLLLSLPN